MADFSSVKFEPNVGTNGAPDWTRDLIGANHSLRWHDTGGVNLGTAYAAWPSITRPSTTQLVGYAYGFTSDTVGYGVLGNGGAPENFAYTHQLQYRIEWDGVGSFASAPVLTCYATTARLAITRGDSSILGGNANDTGPTPRSYIKAAMFGRVDSAGAPATTPSGNPAVTDGANGAVTPGGATSWSDWQGLMGDNDWLLANFTPAATTADKLYLMMVPFTGPYQTEGILEPVFSLRYTHT